MKINLRKANALQLAIKQALNEIKVKTTVTIARFDDPVAAFDKARGEHLKAIRNKGRLITALYDVRKLVAQAGAEAGVSDILSQVARIDKTIELYMSVTAREDFAPESHEILKAQFEDMKNEEQGKNAYHRRRDSIDVNLIQKTDSNAKILALIYLAHKICYDWRKCRALPISVSLFGWFLVTPLPSLRGAL